MERKTLKASDIRGYYTALMTPFKDDRVDTDAFVKLVDWQIREGIHGIVPCGTTGESPTLLDDEASTLYRLAVDTAAGRVPVIAGCGSNSTRHAIHLTQLAQDAGADAALHVVPYYNKPTQEGMNRHFAAVHDATDIPIIIYNIPGRTGVNMDLATQQSLSGLPRIIGVKDSTGDLTRPLRTRATVRGDFAQMSGEDALALPFLAQGGDGIISVTSNIAPGLCSEMFNAWAGRDVATAQAINERLLPLHDAMFSETSPGPVKFAASQMGLCRNELRQPLWPVGEATQMAILSAMRGAGLLHSRKSGQIPVLAGAN